MSESYWTGAYFFLGWLLFQHLVSPLFVYRLHRGPDRYSFVPAECETYISESSPAFLQHHNELGLLGFSPVAASVLELSHSRTSFVLYKNDLDQCVAMIMNATNKLGETLVLDFTQRYEGGKHLSLTNSPVPSVYPGWNKKVMLRFPKVKKVTDLFHIFKNVRGKFNYENPIAFPSGRELQMVEEFLNEELQNLVDRGFMRIEGGKQRPTLLASYLISWRLTWPWKPILNLIANYRAASFAKA